MFCGHEYAVAAMTYVAHIDPTNQAAKGKLDWAKVRDTYHPVWMVYHAEGVEISPIKHYVCGSRIDVLTQLWSLLCWSTFLTVHS